MKLNNVIVRVSDLERSASFYNDILGLKESGRVEGEFVFFDAGGATLAIRETKHAVSPGDSELSFEVADIKSTYESLKSRVSFSQPPRPVTGTKTSDLYAMDFRDPDGHVLSITCWVAKPPP